MFILRSQDLFLRSGEESDPGSDWGFFNTKGDENNTDEDDATRPMSQTDLECLFE